MVLSRGRCLPPAAIEAELGRVEICDLCCEPATTEIAKRYYCDRHQAEIPRLPLPVRLAAVLAVARGRAETEASYSELATAKLHMSDSMLADIIKTLELQEGSLQAARLSNGALRESLQDLVERTRSTAAEERAESRERLGLYRAFVSAGRAVLNGDEPLLAPQSEIKAAIDAAEKRAASLKTALGSGRPADTTLERRLYALILLYERATGRKATVTSRSIQGNERSGPFVNFVAAFFAWAEPANRQGNLPEKIKKRLPGIQAALRQARPKGASIPQAD